MGVDWKEEYRRDFVAGASALSTAFAVMHPLDTAKTLIQTNSKVTFNALSRGFTASVLGAAGQGGLRLATYEHSKRSLSTAFPDCNPFPVTLVSAFVGDTVSSIVKVPREVITVQLQSRNGELSPLACIRSIMRQDGPLGFFRGFTSTTLRDWPFMGILFCSYEGFKVNHDRLRFLPRETALCSNKTLDRIETVLFGGLSGALAGFFTTPFDLIKTRIMTDPQHSSIWRVARSIHGSNPRVSAFFVGSSARTIWWFCVCSIFFPFYEELKDRFVEPSIKMRI